MVHIAYHKGEDYKLQFRNYLPSTCNAYVTSNPFIDAKIMIGELYKNDQQYPDPLRGR